VVKVFRYPAVNLNDEAACLAPHKGDGIGWFSHEGIKRAAWQGVKEK
jgi:hypothetical protein